MVHVTRKYMYLMQCSLNCLFNTLKEKLGYVCVLIQLNKGKNKNKKH